MSHPEKNNQPDATPISPELLDFPLVAETTAELSSGNRLEQTIFARLLMEAYVNDYATEDKFHDRDHFTRLQLIAGYSASPDLKAFMIGELLSWKTQNETQRRAMAEILLAIEQPWSQEIGTALTAANDQVLELFAQGFKVNESFSNPNIEPITNPPAGPRSNLESMAFLKQYVDILQQMLNFAAIDEEVKAQVLNDFLRQIIKKQQKRLEQDNDDLEHTQYPPEVLTQRTYETILPLISTAARMGLKLSKQVVDWEVMNEVFQYEGNRRHAIPLLHTAPRTEAWMAVNQDPRIIDESAPYPFLTDTGMEAQVLSMVYPTMKPRPASEIVVERIARVQTAYLYMAPSEHQAQNKAELSEFILHQDRQMSQLNALIFRHIDEAGEPGKLEQVINFDVFHQLMKHQQYLAEKPAYESSYYHSMNTLLTYIFGLNGLSDQVLVGYLTGLAEKHYYRGNDLPKVVTEFFCDARPSVLREETADGKPLWMKVLPQVNNQAVADVKMLNLIVKRIYEDNREAMIVDLNEHGQTLLLRYAQANFRD